MNDLLELLDGGDLRSDGHADEVAGDVIQDPELFPLLFDGLDEENDVVRGRTAHSLEKVSKDRPELFDGLKPIDTAGAQGRTSCNQMASSHALCELKSL
jgi:HEAT repeat protein